MKKRLLGVFNGSYREKSFCDSAIKKVKFVLHYEWLALYWSFFSGKVTWTKYNRPLSHRKLALTARNTLSAWPRPLFRPITNHRCHQIPNPLVRQSLYT